MWYFSPTSSAPGCNRVRSQMNEFKTCSPFKVNIGLALSKNASPRIDRRSTIRSLATRTIRWFGISKPVYCSSGFTAIAYTYIRYNFKCNRCSLNHIRRQCPWRRRPHHYINVSIFPPFTFQTHDLWEGGKTKVDVNRSRNMVIPVLQLCFG